MGLRASPDRLAKVAGCSTARRGDSPSRWWWTSPDSFPATRGSTSLGPVPGRPPLFDRRSGGEPAGTLRALNARAPAPLEVPDAQPNGTGRERARCSGSACRSGPSSGGCTCPTTGGPKGASCCARRSAWRRCPRIAPRELAISLAAAGFVRSGSTTRAPAIRPATQPTQHSWRRGWRASSWPSTSSAPPARRGRTRGLRIGGSLAAVVARSSTTWTPWFCGIPAATGRSFVRDKR